MPTEMALCPWTSLCLRLHQPGAQPSMLPRVHVFRRTWREQKVFSKDLEHSGSWMENQGQQTLLRAVEPSRSPQPWGDLATPKLQWSQPRTSLL